MSRIGLTPITVPDSVSITIADSQITVKGPKGEMHLSVPVGISVKQEEQTLKVNRSNDEIQSKANHGLIRSLLNNMVIGVTEGYTKKLEMIGTGYRARKQGNGLAISAGFSHPVEFVPPAGVTLDTEGETIIVVSGADKQAVGEAAAKIRSIRKPEPYKGKGIRYQGEIIRRKAGKATKAGA